MSYALWFQSKRTDCNHIFLNFVPTLTLADPAKLEDTVKSMVLRYGPRIWKLRVMEAEIKMTIKYESFLGAVGRLLSRSVSFLQSCPVRQRDRNDLSS